MHYGWSKKAMSQEILKVIGQTFWNGRPTRLLRRLFLHHSFHRSLLKSKLRSVRDQKAWIRIQLELTSRQMESHLSRSNQSGRLHNLNWSFDFLYAQRTFRQAHQAIESIGRELVLSENMSRTRQENLRDGIGSKFGRFDLGCTKC